MTKEGLLYDPSKLPLLINTLQEIAESPNTKFSHTSSPNIFCTNLPSHWRTNKQLPCQFKVVVLSELEDNTKVTVKAGNEENPSAELKGNVVSTRNQLTSSRTSVSSAVPAAQAPVMQGLKAFQGGYSIHIWDLTAQTGCCGWSSRLTAHFEEFKS